MVLTPAIPRFHIEMRHPQVGWQTVEVSNDPAKIEELFGQLVESHNKKYSFSLSEISGDQCWEIHLHHTGTHDYAETD